jgi:hypothetical protein
VLVCTIREWLIDQDRRVTSPFFEQRALSSSLANPEFPLPFMAFEPFSSKPGGSTSCAPAGP